MISSDDSEIPNLVCVWHSMMNYQAVISGDVFAMIHMTRSTATGTGMDEGAASPQAALDLLSYNLIRSCKLLICVCCQNDINCTDMCRFPTSKDQTVTES